MDKQRRQPLVISIFPNKKHSQIFICCFILGGYASEKEGSMGIPEKDPGYDVVVYGVHTEIDYEIIPWLSYACIFSDH